MTIETPLPEPHDRAAHVPPIPAAGQDAVDGDDISVLDILLAVAERKHLVFWVTLAFALVAVVLSLALPSVYTATVTLLPPQQNTSMGALMGSQLGSMGGIASFAGFGLGLKNPNEAYAGMLRSRTVEDAMVQRFGLMQEYRKSFPTDARGAFENHSSVDASGKDNLIHISVEDRDPRRAAELANGYVEQFRSLSQHLAITEAAQRRLFFEQELDKAKNNLGDAEEALKTTEQKTGLFQLDSQARALIESAASLRAQITAREVQIQGMETYATGENAQLVQARTELNTLRAQLAKLGGSADSTGDELIVPNKGAVPAAGIEYARRLRDLKYAETIYEILARQFEVAKLDEAREGAVIQVVDAAVPPDKRSFPKRSLMVLGATAFGFLLGIVLALIQASLKYIRDDPGTSEKYALLKRALRVRKPSAS
jgi:uncharacterized protein involved in exopolysaccharide biosynthesis